MNLELVVSVVGAAIAGGAWVNTRRTRQLTEEKHRIDMAERATAKKKKAAVFERDASDLLYEIFRKQSDGTPYPQPIERTHVYALGSWVGYDEEEVQMVAAGFRRDLRVESVVVEGTKITVILRASALVPS